MGLFLRAAIFCKKKSEKMGSFSGSLARGGTYFWGSTTSSPCFIPIELRHFYPRVNALAVLYFFYIIAVLHKTKENKVDKRKL